MELSIVVCTYNREKYLEQSLNSLVNQSLDKKYYEIILVNNNSTDSTEAICNQFKNQNPELNFTYFLELNQGLSFARNKGIELSNGKIIVFLDDDAFASEKYLEEILIFFNENKNAAAFGGRIYPKFESQKPAWMSSFLMSLASVIDLGDEVKTFKYGQYPIGANMGIRKDIFEKYGVFDTKLGRVGKGMQGGEEKDIFYRIISNNESIYYLPNAWVYHIVPDVRLQNNFIRKQALGVGYSEKMRSKNIGQKEVLKSIIKELMKWIASIFLFLYFSLIFQFPKGQMIIKFRYWVSIGFLYEKL
ncbi:MAG: hypothetical protein A2033_05000 [Bacteroidetes bacterium GWA2_31_9]|nr:MAG: hypothetical protein A2033_05000 [Bacteroidetes bacterium GWA2_31_9]